jgi:hypothetical protein
MQFHYVWVGGGLLPILFLTENKTMFCIFFHTVVCDGDREVLGCDRLDYAHKFSASTFNRKN